MHRFALSLTMIASLAWPAFAAPYGDKTVVLTLQTNVTLTYYFSEPSVNSRREAVILFIGGAGVLPKQPKENCTDNFLVRVRKQFLDAGYAVAIPDVPTDHAQGLLGHYRSSEAHAARDIRALVYDVRDHAGRVPIWLVGTSRGSISAASGGARLSPHIAGLVLTSTVTRHTSNSNYGSDTVFEVPLQGITVPTLLVGHARDKCPISPPGDGNGILQKLSGAPVKARALVYGGIQTAPSDTELCEPDAPHGFCDSESEAMHVILKFMAHPTGN